MQLHGVERRGAVEVLSTSAVVRERRLEVWRAYVRDTCGDVRVLNDERNFGNGTIVRGNLGTTKVAVISADPHVVVRTRTTSDEGYLYVCQPRSGRARIRQDGKSADAMPGQIVSFDTTRPYSLELPETFEMVAVRFDHRALGIRPQSSQELTAAPWSVTDGLSAIIGNLLTALGNHLCELDLSASEVMQDTVASVIRALFAERLQSSERPCAVRQILTMRIQAFAREHLRDPALTPAALAKQHNVSLRYLQLLFAEQGTSPAKWIRDERLARCYSDLRDPRFARMTVAAIGERWGLYGASQISRLFREHYGLCPRDVRREALDIAG